MTTDVKFGSWSVAESPITVEYSLVVIEEIRHEVAEGYQRLSRGGIEVGGVLYGTRDGRTLRVLAIRPIACEHARGPGFLFSDKDRVALNEQLLRDKDDPQFKDLISVGWFLSHTRTEIALTESDLEIYSIFFPAPWQVTMVVRPGRGGTMRAGFFLREADGTVRGDRSYLEFNFPDRLAGVLDLPERPARERVPRENAERRTAAVFRSEQVGIAAGAPAGTATGAVSAMVRRELPAVVQTLDQGPQLLLPQPAKRKWPWLLAWALVLIAAIVFGLRYWMPSTPEPMALTVVERDSQLQIEWNHSAKPVATAVRGSLQILDGADLRTVPLTPQALASGKFAYQRKSGDIEVRMTVENAEGAKSQEASRFLGHPPAATPPVAAAPAPAPAVSQDVVELQKRREELEAEVQRLRRENSSQADKIRQLERTLRVLETRLNIDK
jgi:proteasome lid subunit RPN8/RPN11